MTQDQFLTDADIANHLSMSPSWVRGQRLKRRNGVPHFLQVDPVMIGTKTPRYRTSDFERFLSMLEATGPEPLPVQ